MEKYRFAMITTISFFLFIPVEIFAFCSSPYAPEPPSTYQRPDKPTVPYCVNTFSNTHTCSEYEIASYNDALRQYQYDIEEYIRKLKNYVSEAEGFASGAVDYANCEIRNLD